MLEENIRTLWSEINMTIHPHIPYGINSIKNISGFYKYMETEM